MHAPTSEDPSATPALLTEQARALVQTEEARFAASQSRATALLAVAGVIASVGGGVLAGLDGRDFALPLDVFGEEVSAVLVAACLTGAIAISCLVWSGTLAIGALQERPDPQPQKLTPVVKEQFPSMLSQGSAQSSQVVLLLLAGQLEVLQKATENLDRALRRSARLLGLAAVNGLLLSMIILFGTTSGPQNLYLLQDEAKNPPSAQGPR